MNTYAERGAPNTGVPGKGKRRYGKGMNGVYSIEIRGRGEVERVVRDAAAHLPRTGAAADKTLRKGGAGGPTASASGNGLKLWKFVSFSFRLKKGRELFTRKKRHRFACRLFRDLHFFLLTCE